MSLEEFLDNLTLEDIEELKKLKLEKVKVYNFSKIGFNKLKELFMIKRNLKDEKVFDKWFNNHIKISTEEVEFLNNLLDREKKYIEIYKEEDLKIKFIAPILNKIDFRDEEREIREFYEEKIEYEKKEFKLKGICDFVVSKGLEYAEKPYFFIQEFKKSIEGDDPRPQLIAELISAVEINNFKIMRGAYIVGAIWNFVILEKIGENSYQYFVSDNFDSTKIENLKEIYKNLLFVKDEIKNMDTGVIV